MDYEMRPFRDGDEQAVLDTFNLVFGADNPDFQPRTLAEWNWQYRENPAGMRLYVAMLGELCVAAYATQPNRVEAHEGRDLMFCQGIDSMAHPEHRRGLKRPGLFVDVAQRAYDHFDEDPIVFGYPNKQAWRIGHSYLRYELVRWQSVLARELGGLNPGIPDAVEEIERFGPEVDRLFQRCAKRWGAALRRDTAYLNWRFVDHPRRDYRIFVVRDAGELLGYAIFGHGDWPVPGVGMLVDFLVDADDVEVGRLLHEAIFRATLDAGLPFVVQILPEWSPWHLRCQDWHWAAFRTDYVMGARNTVPRFDMFFLRDHWWYTMAELDLA